VKIFLSWSGKASKELAEALRDWIPNVIQSAEPWISTEIEKGARWADDLAWRLKDTRVGILCLTSENLESPWIHFEAGSLSKTVDKSFVCPYLLNVDESSVKYPLAQFQATKFDQADTLRLLQTINRAQGEGRLDESRLETVFHKWWPDFESLVLPILASLEADNETPAPIRPEREMLEEILSLVREQRREPAVTANIPNFAERFSLVERGTRILMEGVLERHRLRQEMLNSGQLIRSGPQPGDRPPATPPQSTERDVGPPPYREG
jgi:hypothetical protein